MTGARFIAETLRGYGVTTIFWMPAIIKPGIMEIERAGVRRVLWQVRTLHSLSR
jgi:hypothetical protein